MKLSSNQPDNKEPQSARQAGTAMSHSGKASLGASGEMTFETQYNLFEQATRLFKSGNFQESREAFHAVSLGPNREIAHTASLHVSMCEKRLSRQAPLLSTPEDHYNYAVALINRRELAEAERHLAIALSSGEGLGHLLYALALCRALQGDLEQSYQHLKKAIELDPGNRSLARNDVDFQEFCRRSPLRDLVYDRTPSA